MRPDIFFTTFIGGMILSLMIVESIVKFIPNKETFRIVMYFGLGYALATYGYWMSIKLNKETQEN